MTVDNFAAFILTNGRADRVYTYKTLRKHGYTGRIYLVIDDEDKQADEYRKRYGDEVLIFSKNEIAQVFDEGDNFNDRRAIIYARNACWNLARQVGVRYFIQLDDDYMAFRYRFDAEYYYRPKPIKSLDRVICRMLDYYKNTPFASIAFAQGGDHVGGELGTYAKSVRTKRKAMNSFICDTERQFAFVGRINEDVNTYTSKQRAGLSFLTILGVSLEQKQSQSNSGGMTELYLDSGTYVKSFYTVMYAPSCAVIDCRKVVGRLHHKINWEATAAKIIREHHRKPRPC